jgi:hypothetical protein
VNGVELENLIKLNANNMTSEKNKCPICGCYAEDEEDQEFLEDVGMCTVCDAHYHDND